MGVYRATQCTKRLIFSTSLGAIGTMNGMEMHNLLGVWKAIDEGSR